jgi:saccharopine dehydrogenase-like NADP-dependent oxidoreductase
MKQILLFGAGKSATVLIDYLKAISTTHQWQVTVADSNLETVQSKVGQHDLVEAVQLDITNETERKKLVANAQVVISMMPPSLHYLIALDCIEFGKHLLTASYVDEKIKQLAEDIKNKGLLFLCEMGLDPGIDHMSAMQLIHRIKAHDGDIISFKSHCGGLIDPESDNNPWHYKISWNPRNIILAGKAGAVYKEHGKTVSKAYESLFNSSDAVIISNKSYAYYPNRDSLNYMSLYGLEDAQTFIRTTLRHPHFFYGWNNIVSLKLTDEEKVYETDGMSVAGFFDEHLKKNNLANWIDERVTQRVNIAKGILQDLKDTGYINAEGEFVEHPENEIEDMMFVDEDGSFRTTNLKGVEREAANMAASNINAAHVTLSQLFFLGLVNDDATIINKGLCSAADILQFVLEKKLALEPTDKDMIVMLHELEYEIPSTKLEVGSTKHKISSSLIVKGEDSLHTAMAKTVGLPLGIAAKLILENKLTVTGLHIPIIAEIYTPVLNELLQNGIIFNEIIEY